MYNEKMDALLALSLHTAEAERERSAVLQLGFDPEQRTWEVIVKFTGSLASLLEHFPDVFGEELLFGYAILQVPEKLLDKVASVAEIAYMEKPKALFFAEKDREQSVDPLCKYLEGEILIGTDVDVDTRGLTGAGTIIGIVDSGIDYAHPDFRNPDGSTRILLLWDQSAQRVFDSSQINAALAEVSEEARYALVPSRDLSGHGTHVAGIAAGNGRASEGRFTGLAPEAELIIVKLGPQRPGTFPRTTELMRGVDFCLRQAFAYRKPIVVNLSFGNNYGSHDGTSLVERYLDAVSGYWESLLVAGTGNEGAGRIHTEGQLQEGETVRIAFAAGDFETGLNLQLWKNYADEMEVSILAPSGERLGILQPELGTQRFLTEGTQILVFYGMPKPYSTSQEIFFDLIPLGQYVDSGIWEIELRAIRVVQGGYGLWLPGQESLGENSGFLQPVETTTLTIPSTTPQVLSVGAYDARTQTMAGFSGRGYTRNGQFIKPDVVAPGVRIMAAAPGGGYTVRSGTSMAAPYASGLAARMMQEGIVEGTDPFLFGAKIIAYMQRMAQPLPGYKNYPNPVTGWGRI